MTAEFSEEQKKILTDDVMVRVSEILKRFQTKPGRKPRKDIGVKRGGPKGKGITKDGPKRPKSGYVIFFSQERPIVNPHLTPTEAMREVAKRWKNLDAEKKKYWNDRALAEKEKEAEAKKTEEDKEISDKKPKEDSDESSEEEDSDAESSEEEESSDESSASESEE